MLQKARAALIEFGDFPSDRHLNNKKGVIMLPSKSKAMKWAAGVCALALLTPAWAAETGSLAARQAAEQKEALAKKAAERAAKKVTESPAPVESKAPSDTTAPAATEKAK